MQEKKQLYAALKIPEYWVTDVKGKRLLAFRLHSDGKYRQCQESVALEGLPISLIERTLERLSQEEHGEHLNFAAIQFVLFVTHAGSWAVTEPGTAQEPACVISCRVECPQKKVEFCVGRASESPKEQEGQPYALRAGNAIRQAQEDARPTGDSNFFCGTTTRT